MQDTTKLVIQYDDLSKHDLLSDFKQYDEIVCCIKQCHAITLKNAWVKYGRYAGAHAENPSKWKNLFLAFNWLVSQVYLDLRYEKLSRLTGLYISAADQLRPVKFTDEDDYTAVHFSKK